MMISLIWTERKDEIIQFIFLVYFQEKDFVLYVFYITCFFVTLSPTLYMQLYYNSQSYVIIIFHYSHVVF